MLGRSSVAFKLLNTDKKWKVSAVELCAVIRISFATEINEIKIISLDFENFEPDPSNLEGRMIVIKNYKFAFTFDISNGFMKNSQICCNTEITVDYYLISTKAKCCFKQYMPNKPTSGISHFFLYFHKCAETFIAKIHKNLEKSF